MFNTSRTDSFSKRLHVLVIAALILVVALAAGPPRAAASDETRNYYIGTLGKTAVQMELVIEMGSGSITGTYYYERIGRPLELQGNIRAGEKITLDETEEKQQKTGTFTGQFAGSPQTFEGTWSSADKKTVLPFRLTQVAEYVLLSAEEERCWSTESPDFIEEGSCSFSFEYPRFLSTSPGLRQINKVVEERAKREYNDFVSIKMSLEEAGKGKRIEKGTDWDDTNAYSIAYYAEDLVSMLLSHLEYAGGAHPLYDFKPASFWIKDGKATPLDLADLFVPQAPYLEVLSNILTSNTSRLAILTGDASKLDEDDLSGFAIYSSGIEFTFGESRGHAFSGSSEVVPFTAITKIIRPNGPLQKFVSLTPAPQRTQPGR